MEPIRPRVGVIAVGRDTFDVDYAKEVLESAWYALTNQDLHLVGSPRLLFNAEDVRGVIAEFQQETLDILLLLQVTFTDAAMTVEIARQLTLPLVMWSFPEPRTGGRLRLNSFCGINLAAHALSRASIGYDYLHGSPVDEKILVQIRALAMAGAVQRSLKGVRIGVIGRHPHGFDACKYSHADLESLFGIEIEEHDLISFLDQVKALPDEVALPLYEERQNVLSNLEEMERSATIKTLKAYVAMRRLISDRGYAGLAVRCWPEFFTHYGAAACGALALLNEHYLPAGCEADVHGVITALILQRLSGKPAFNTDLVDLDRESNTCVFWHCGQAPIQMADPEADIRATIHSNRKLPLLNEFPLKPGRFTLARLSKGQNRTRLAIGGGEMLRAPLAFSGTAGVARLDRPVEELLATLIENGLEHHSAVVYGDHRFALRRLAGLLNLEIVRLTH